MSIPVKSRVVKKIILDNQELKDIIRETNSVDKLAKHVILSPDTAATFTSDSKFNELELNLG